MGKEHQLDIMPLLHAPLAVSPFDDITEGPGFHVRLGEGTVQIFPNARTARAELGGDRVRVTHLTRLAVEEGALIVYGESDEHWSALHLDARSLTLVTTRRNPSDAVPQHAATEAEIVSSETDPPAAEEFSEGSVPEDDDTSAMVNVGTDAVPRRSPSTAEIPNRIEHERVTLVGRIGYTPKFRETSKGTLVGTFALAVHPEPGVTTWHKIVVFGERAQKMRDGALSKGDEVEVIGYEHTKTCTDAKTGQEKQEVELYAAVVKKPRAKE